MKHIDPEDYETAERTAVSYSRRWFLRLAHRPSAIPLSDIEQEARIGVFDASRIFDPTRGVKFKTHATTWALGYAKRYVRDFGRGMRSKRDYYTPRLDDLPEVERPPLSLETELIEGRTLQDALEGGVRLEQTVVMRETVQQALKLLTPRQRLVLWRYYVERDSQQVIADDLGLSQMCISRELRTAQRRFVEVWPK